MLIILLILALIIFLVIYVNRKSNIQIIGRWEHLIQNFQFSSDEFYKLLENELNSRQIPDIRITRGERFEGGYFSDRREYLQVSWRDYAIDFCAAPFGTSYFFSEWVAFNPGFWKNVFKKNQAISLQLSMKTYYQHDTIDMFKLSVHAAFTSCVDKITASKGIRSLTEIETQIQNLKKR